MGRHGGPYTHSARRSWWRPWRKRCDCGNELPCVVRRTLDRQQFFTGPAAASWATERTAAVPPIRASRPPLRLTPGQAYRSSQGGRW
jgi:hypothetical protein